MRVPDDDDAAVAARLRDLRLAHGMEMKPWAKHVKLGLTAWSNYEREERKISLKAALKLCAKTGISLDWIYRGIEGALPFEIKEKLDAYYEAQGRQDPAPKALPKIRKRK